MLRFAQHDNRGVITCHAEWSEAESKHLIPPMPNIHWITVVYLGQFLYGLPIRTIRLVLVPFVRLFTPQQFAVLVNS